MPPSLVPPPATVEATFCFVDMAGFTALTEIHGDEQALDMATRFCGCAESALAEGDALIKSIGDAVFVTCSGPRAGLAFVQKLSELAANTVDEGGAIPALRVGLHHGSAVTRGGDVFGASVNLTARIAARAEGGELLATESVAAVASSQGLEVIDVGLVSFKNVKDPVRLFSLPIGGADLAVDPVCRMRVDRRRATARVRHEGAEQWFCSLTCVAAFAACPDAYQGPLGRGR